MPTIFIMNEEIEKHLEDAKNILLYLHVVFFEDKNVEELAKWPMAKDVENKILPNILKNKDRWSTHIGIDISKFKRKAAAGVALSILDNDPYIMESIKRLV